MPALSAFTEESPVKHSSVSRNDGRLDLPTSIQHVPQDLLQARERRFSGDVVGGPNLLGRDQSKRPADGFRRVMKCRLQGDFGVVQAIGLQLNLGAAGAPAEEIHGAAFADHIHRPFPGFRLADSFYAYIATAPL